MEKRKLKAKPKRGPKPEVYKIEGMNWEEAVRKSFAKKKAKEGWAK